MKYLLIFLFLPSICMATTHDELVEHIKLRCNFLNEKIPFDVRMDCMTDYINCAVVGAGEIDLKKADDKCLKQSGKRREDAQFQN